MTRRDDGGPAFPRPASEYTKSGSLPDGNDAIVEQDGMTLRDYFAAKAMQGWLTTYGVDTRHPAQRHHDERLDDMSGARRRVDDLAAYSYSIADAMIRARGQQ